MSKTILHAILTIASDIATEVGKVDPAASLVASKIAEALSALEAIL